MVGGRKEGEFTIKNSNVFAALDNSRKKKSKDKKSGSSKSSSKASTAKAKEQEPQVLMPTRLKASTAWGDIDSEDEDDFYATEVPLRSAWGGSQPAKEPAPPAEESESEDDMLDLGDEEAEDEHGHDESEAPVHLEPPVKEAPEVPAPTKETERQLSKKERKKKELEELEALLADFGVNNGNGEGVAQENKPEDQKKADTDNGEKKDAVLTESKNAKKKKKKTTKDAKETQDQPSSEGPAEPTETTAGTDQVEDEVSSHDIKERLKKMAAAKKKRSNKEMDAAAKAAAVEATARNAKLVAAKKREKNHYNQQPVR